MQLMRLNVYVGGEVGTYEVFVNPMKVQTVAELKKDGVPARSEVWIEDGGYPVCYNVMEPPVEVARLFLEATA